MYRKFSINRVTGLLATVFTLPQLSEDRVYLGEMAQYQFNVGPQTLKIYELNPRFVDASEDRELYAGAHLNVVTSRHESANVTVLEAAATGLATAGFQVGYLADWHPDKAVAVPVGDVDGLADAIRGLLQDRAKRDRIAAAAREWTVAHDAGWTADAFERLFHRVLHDRHAGLRNRTAGDPSREA